MFTPILELAGRDVAAEKSFAVISQQSKYLFTF
jgi:hypothetical protein